MKKAKIQVSYVTNKSYPYWKGVLKDLIIDYDKCNDSYYIDDEIKNQYGLENGEYIVTLEWDYENAEIIEEGK